MTLEDRIIAVLRETPTPLPSIEIWRRIGCLGARTSVASRLCLMKRANKVASFPDAGPSNSQISPTLWGLAQ